MAKVLVIWKANWADEMDIEGFKIYTEDDWKAYKGELKAMTKKFTISVGTNEEIDYDCGSELLNQLTVKKISDDETKFIKKMFGDEFGFTQFTEAYQEEDDEDYDLEYEEDEEESWLNHD